MADILLLILKAIAIGVIISAPMGPVGVLCIQRTLNKGRAIGMATGVGAAISDLMYCLLTAFCLSFVEDFLLRNQTALSLGGSVLLICFGIYLFRNNPVRSLKPRSGKKASVKSAVLTGYLFTFSNPLIVVLIMGLFTRFNFLDTGYRIYHHIFAFLFIFGGAVLWWYGVTFFVNKLKAHFNLRSIWVINRITGSIIILFSLFGLVSGIITLCK